MKTIIRRIRFDGIPAGIPFVEMDEGIPDITAGDSMNIYGKFYTVVAMCFSYIDKECFILVKEFEYSKTTILKSDTD